MESELYALALSRFARNETQNSSDGNKTEVYFSFVVKGVQGQGAQGWHGRDVTPSILWFHHSQYSTLPKLSQSHPQSSQQEVGGSKKKPAWGGRHSFSENTRMTSDYISLASA